MPVFSPRSRSAVLACLLVLGVAAPAAAPGAPADRVELSARLVPGEAIVRFERGAAAAERAAVRDAAGVEFERALHLPRSQVVSFDGRVGPALERLERTAEVDYAQPNYRYRALGSTPNDTLFSRLWGLGAVPGVDAPDVWDRTRGAGQVIAIVDTGVDLTHPDLVDNLWSNPGEAAGNGIDDEGNGRVDDLRGFDFADEDSDPDDFQFHGTHVAGTAAAEANNQLGVAGVAPAAQVMAVRVLDGDGGGTSADVGDGVSFAAREGAGVINLSLGGPAGAGDEFMADAIETAGDLGAVVVASAGNDGDDNDLAPSSPCTLPGSNLICVASVTASGTRSSFSNFGLTTVDVGAPGSGILSTKTDWGSPVLDEDFEDGIGGWTSFADGSGVNWGASIVAAPGSTRSAADSPIGSYQSSRYSELRADADLDLTGRRGCRMHFDARYDIEPPQAGFYTDLFLAGAFLQSSPGVEAARPFAGNSAGFGPEEVTISALDDQPDARPFFAVDSDSSVVADGAYVDNLRVLCRDGSYVDAEAAVDLYDEPGSGNYVSFSGTSMAAPHVAGVAALVRAAAPGIAPAAVVQAILGSATPQPSLAGMTVSGGTANAPAAIAAALELPAPPTDGGGGAPAPTNPSQPPALPAPPAALPAPPATLSEPQRLDLRRARTLLRTSRGGRFMYAFRAPPGFRGEARFRTRFKALVVPARAGTRAKRAHLLVARRSFRTPSGGRVTLRLKLSRRHLALLRRNGRLRLRVGVKAADSQGRVVRSGRNLTLLAPR